MWLESFVRLLPKFVRLWRMNTGKWSLSGAHHLVEHPNDGAEKKVQCRDPSNSKCLLSPKLLSFLKTLKMDIVLRAPRDANVKNKMQHYF